MTEALAKHLGSAQTPQLAAKTATESVLDIQSSILGKKWVFADIDARLAQGISQAYGLPDILGRLLASRGIGFDQIPAFLDPSIKSHLPNPSTLQDMDKAAERIADAIVKGQKVGVFGDYDVDGATSSALLRRYFSSLGMDISVYIPDRIKEGYGPNAAALESLRAQGCDLVITVDCGVTAFEAIAAGTKAGLDIIILDHHRAEAQLPDAVAVVNPNRLDDTSGQGHMAACGVVFLTLVAINRCLRQRGWFSEARPEPRILQWLDIVALGTVCDVVPLTGVNRAFVAQGLKIMAMRQNPGLVALSDVANVMSAPSAFHAGFIFGPRVNAGGRVGESILGAKLLSTDDPFEARQLAMRLHEYNTERKQIEEGVINDAIAYVEDRCRDDIVLIVEGRGWHPGVIGIVAARLKEKYNKPACVVAFDDNGIGKASARSVAGIDLGAAVIAAKQNDLLVAGGGHKMAAGFTVTRDQLADFRAFMNRHVADQLQGAPQVAELRVDSLLSISSLNLALAEKLEQLGPYGAGHAEPRFALPSVKIVRPTVVGEKHVSCFLQDTAGGASVKAIAFRALDSDLGTRLLKAGSVPLHLAGHVSINEWQGRKSVQFQVVDAAAAW